MTANTQAQAVQAPAMEQAPGLIARLWKPVLGGAALAGVAGTVGFLYGKKKGFVQGFQSCMKTSFVEQGSLEA